MNSKPVDPPAVAPAVPVRLPPNLPTSNKPDELQLQGIEERIRGQANLQHLGLAIQLFHEMYQLFPPENVSSDLPAEKGMSWLTGLLPYVGQEQVYLIISKEDAWDAASNRDAAQIAVPVFLHKPGVDGRDSSGYGLAQYAGNVNVLGDRHRRPYEILLMVRPIFSWRGRCQEAIDRGPIPEI